MHLRHAATNDFVTPAFFAADRRHAASPGKYPALRRFMLHAETQPWRAYLRWLVGNL